MLDKQDTTNIAFQKLKTDPPIKKKSFHKWIVIGLLLCLTIGWVGGSILPLKGLSTIKRNLMVETGLGNSDKIDTIRNIMENDWYFSKDITDLDTRLTDNALMGMMNNPEDTHTQYMSAEETEAFTQSINRDFVGIGVEIIVYNNETVVTRVIDNSPAQKGGMEPGDVLLKADNTSLIGLSASEVRNVILGEKGSSVTIQVRRGSDTLNLSFIRDEIEDTSTSKMIDANDVYVHLFQFGNSTAKQLKNQLDKLIAGKSSVNMVLDLRDNGGGYLDSVKDVASLFLPKGDIVLQEEDKDGNKTTYKADGNKIDNIDKIVILVNENTASAAEVMTLALKENLENVTLVGVTTYGKGTVQQTVSFSDGTALKYTVARWLSPKGNWINNTGIIPDKIVALPDALNYSYPQVKEDESYQVDSVSSAVKAVQMILQYFGYSVDRTDGYYSTSTNEVLRQFASDHNISFDNVINQSIVNALYSELQYAWATDKSKDTQYITALEVLHGQ